MTTASTSNNHAGPAPETEKLCGLLLEIVGRGPGRMATARRHARVLDAAMPHMSQDQWAEARRRILALETRWGPMLPGDKDELETNAIPPETRVARWLSTRTIPVRHLRVLHRAASKVAAGGTCLSDIRDHAFAYETDHVLIPVRLDSFAEWMIELRIVRRVAKGVFELGSLCWWWVNEVTPSKDRSSTYQRCLEQREQIRRKRAAGYGYCR